MNCLNHVGTGHTVFRHHEKSMKTDFYDFFISKRLSKPFSKLNVTFISANTKRWYTYRMPDKYIGLHEFTILYKLYLLS